MRPIGNYVRFDIILHRDDPRDLAIIEALGSVDPRRRAKKFRHLAYDGVLAQKRQPNAANGTVEGRHGTEATRSPKVVQKPTPVNVAPAPVEYEPEIGDPAEFLDMIAKQASFFESKSWDGK